MKILLLPDRLDNWSAHNRCKALKRFLPEYEIDIMAGEGNAKELSEISDNYDLIHFNYICYIEEYSQFVIDNSKKCIITIINERSLLTGYAINIAVVEQMLKNCACATSLNSNMGKRYNCIYIPNGVDLELFKNPKGIVVGYVGTAKKNKGVQIAEQVCADLALPFKTLLYQKTQVPHESMPDFYRELDVFVHLSESEGCSNPVLEALAMNVPVIMTKQGIWDELVDYVQFIDRSYKSLYNALLKYKARRLIEKRFSWEKIAKEYGTIYERVNAKNIR